MPRWIAVALALFVTFLWSTSYILNKWAFAEGIGPLTLAGARYALAALTLLLVRGAIRLQPPRGPAAAGGGSPPPFCSTWAWGWQATWSRRASSMSGSITSPLRRQACCSRWAIRCWS